MSKKLTLLALAAIALGSASVCANIEAQCRSELAKSKRPVPPEVVNKRCACVKARHEHHHDNFAKANEHCKDNNDRP